MDADTTRFCLNQSKAELDSLHGVTMDSTKLLTEKLTLARELSSLKPEVEHLRSQAVSYQSLLAEKLALQRQLSTILVELETERRSTQRMMAREDHLNAEDAKLESRIATLQAELAQESRDKKKCERDNQKMSIESENKKAALESRLDSFREKLKKTKEKLKETQLNLEAAQAAASAQSDHPEGGVNTIAARHQNSRKRTSAQMEADTMIGTPGDLPAMKKSNKGTALVGEKSTFSITPFLNRAASIAPESPHSDELGSCRPEIAGSDSHIHPESQSGPVLQKVKAFKLKFNAVSETAQSKRATMLEAPRSNKLEVREVERGRFNAVPGLEKVTEESNSEDVIGTLGHIISKSDGGAETKRGKRKLLGDRFGKTVFEEDEGDIVKGHVGLGVGAGVFGAPAKGILRGSNPGYRKGQGSNAFGAISPLKRDRRQVP